MLPIININYMQSPHYTLYYTILHKINTDILQIAQIAQIYIIHWQELVLGPLLDLQHFLCLCCVLEEKKQHIYMQIDLSQLYIAHRNLLCPFTCPEIMCSLHSKIIILAGILDLYIIENNYCRCVRKSVF